MRKHIPLRNPGHKATGVIKIAVFTISLLLVIYNLARIINIPLTHDECASYDFITMPYRDILAFKIVSANNHLLNTLCRKFFVGTFSDTPFWLRFDSLLAQIIFLLYSYRICRELFAKSIWQLGVFLALNLHPFMFEFWGLSRGYGLAVAFMIGSVYYLLLYVRNKKLSVLCMALLFSILAVYSNFTLLDYYCAVVFFVCISPFISGPAITDRARILKACTATFAASAVLYLLVAGPVEKLIAQNELYYGGTKNIVSDTIASVLKWDFFTPYESNYYLLHMQAWLVAAAAFVAGLYWVVSLLRKRAVNELPAGVLLSMLLIVPAACIIAQHLLFKTLYPIDRTAIFFIPLFVLLFTYSIHHVFRYRPVVGIAGLCIFTIPLAVTFLLQANVRYTSIWQYGSNDLVVLRRMMTANHDPAHKIKIRAYWIFVPSFNYYIETRYTRNFESVVYDHDFHITPDTNYDYYYVPAEYVGAVPGIYKTDTSFFGGKYYLLRKTHQ